MVGSVRFSNFKADLSYYRKSLAVQFRAAASLRGAFALQVIGMVLNNIALLVAWIFLFVHFGSIHGWTAAELIGVQGINMLVFGVMMFTNTGLMDLPRHVDQGSFDNFITRPTSILSQVSSSNIDVSTLGDMALGIVLTLWYIFHAHSNGISIALFALALIAACILFWCFALLLPNLLAFYIFDGERVSRYLGFVFLDGGIYPTGVLTGPLRTILLTVFPSLFIGAVQLDILRGLNPFLVVLGLVVALFWLKISLLLFNRSLRNYESASLTGAR